MRKLILFIFLFQFFNLAWAVTERAIYTDPKLIEALMGNGVGAVYNFKLDNGGYARYRVTNLHLDDKKRVLTVEGERVGKTEKIVFDDSAQFPDKPVTDLEIGGNENGIQTDGSSTGGDIIPVPPSELGSAEDYSHSQQDTPSSGSDASANAGVSWNTGAGSAALEGVAVAIVLGSGLNQKINEAYREIAEDNARRDKNVADTEATKGKLNGQIKNTLEQLEPNDNLVNKVLKIQFKKTKEELDADIQNSIKSRPYQWQSQDPDFRARAQGISQRLHSRPVQNNIEQTYQNIGDEALKIGDQQSVEGAKDDADDALDIAETAADIFVGLDPYTGTLRSLYESVTGQNMITGKDLSDGERALAVIGVVTGGFAAKGPRMLKALEKVGEKVAPRLKATFRGTQSLFRALGHGKKGTFEGQRILRKINLSSNLDKKWGLTKRHLDKHFFEHLDISLKKIDPGGNVEKWLNEIGDLASRPVTQVTPNGALDIIGEFPKADGSGTYKMALRLWERPDGTFDLITFLTDQRKF